MTVSEATSPRASQYFSQLAEGYELAAEQGDEVTFGFSIGPWPLELSFASPELARTLTPPLERLLDGWARPPLGTIRAWDSASTATRLPPLDWHAAQPGPGGALRGYTDQRFRALYRDDESGFHTLSMFDMEQRLGFFWFANHELIHWYERAEPVRAGIHWTLNTERRYLVHASAVGDARGAVLLAGKGGAGKTTTTLAAVVDGLSFIGDNYVLLSLEEQTLVFGLYGNAKLWPQTLEHLPQLAPYVKTFDVARDEKLVVDITAYKPGRIATGIPVRAVVLAEVAGAGETRLSQCSAVEALLGLAPTTIFQLPSSGGELRAMAELMRRVPAYKLKLGGDVMRGPRVLSELLDELAC